MIAYEGTAPYIFISYAHSNAAAVLPILTEMAKKGFRFWYDNGIMAGASWADDIADHIAASRYVMAFISEAWMASTFCRNELSYAVEQGKPIVPIYIEPNIKETRGVRMFLGGYQALYAYQFETTQAFVKKLEAEVLLQACRDTASAALSPKEAVSNTPAPKAPPAPKPRSTINMQDFEIHGSVLAKYKGPGGVVYLPEGLTEIGKYAFAGAAVTGVALSSTVKIIGNRAFSKCTSLRAVKLGEKTETIGVGAFERCSALVSVTGGVGVTDIMEHAFSQCAALPAIELPRLKMVGRFAFSGCDALRLMKLPTSVVFLHNAVPATCRLEEA